MFAKVYNFKFPGLSEAKVAATFCSEKLGKKIVPFNIRSLNISIGKCGSISINLKFETGEDLNKFEANSKEFFQDLLNTHKKLDALINVAGVLRFDNSHEVELDNWNKILDINLTGTFFMCRYALPLLLESKGAIVNVSSTAAIGAHAWTAAYSASKGGISAFSKTLAVEYGMRGLNINCVCPASIETPMSSNPHMPKDIDTRLLKKIMLFQIMSF